MHHIYVIVLCTPITVTNFFINEASNNTDCYIYRTIIIITKELSKLLIR